MGSTGALAAVARRESTTPRIVFDCPKTGRPSTNTTPRREAAAKIFADFVKPHDQGGLCGMKFSPEQTFVVGETLNIQWKAEADFLAEPYKGSDACETHDGLMAAMVSTFKGSDLKMKK